MSSSSGSDDSYTPRPRRSARTSIQSEAVSFDVSTPATVMRRRSKRPENHDEDSNSSFSFDAGSENEGNGRKTPDSLSLRHTYSSDNPTPSRRPSILRRSSSATDAPSRAPSRVPSTSLPTPENTSASHSILLRLKAAFLKFAAEPALKSPPPTRSSSRRTSFSSETDIMARAMDLNDDRVVDIDDPALDSPKAGADKELPFFLRYRGAHKPAQPNLARQGSNMSYKQRRKMKKAKHRIVFHQDSESCHTFQPSSPR